MGTVDGGSWPLRWFQAYGYGMTLTYCLVAEMMVTGALTGLIWVVQIVLYPGFLKIDQAGFASYHRDYMRRISLVVGPLMLAELGVASIRAFVWGGAGAWAGLVLIGGIWVSTAVLQAPMHSRLQENREEGIMHRLVATNWIRTVLWTGRLVLLAATVVRFS